LLAGAALTGAVLVVAVSGVVVVAELGVGAAIVGAAPSTAIAALNAALAICRVLVLLRSALLINPPQELRFATAGYRTCARFTEGLGAQRFHRTRRRRKSRGFARSAAAHFRR
jgi:hypothetical protein